jgi:hypothetical protein
MRGFHLLVLLIGKILMGGSWTAGLGAGVYGVPYVYSPFSWIEVNTGGVRAEIQSGYYGGEINQGSFDLLTIYGETLGFYDDNQFSRNQHLSLLGEYRLFVINEAGTIQAAVGAGPSLHRFVYYTDQDTWRRPVQFTVDGEFAFLFFISRHLFLRAQTTYSFPPLYPRNGVFGLVLGANYRT